ncbi:SufD family Fe-S cluster assembly protein [Spirochaeta cellobiosiphila]|uniref:SufD family Fe-S cluster assembly protein n=1 Tax=Spirochaeta cellobiosiphila TaxID=504483 RepID=UPI00040340AA|nr:SufD family Fe-S cluster assembly protein [Spirochaeta cellobiosiphila]
MTTTFEKIGKIDYQSAADMIDSFNESTERSNWRKKSATSFVELAMPGKPDEAWRRVRLSPVLLDKALEDCQIGYDGIPSGVSVYSLSELSGDGFKEYETYITRYTELSKLRAAKDKPRANDVKENKLLSLNKAFSQNGLFIVADENFSSGDVLRFQFSTQSDKIVAIPQIHLWAKKGSKGQILIEFIAKEDSKNVIIPYSTGVIEDNAEWEVLTNQETDDNSQFYMFDSYYMQTKSKFSSYLFTQGAKQSFVDGHYTLQGRKAEFHMYGISTAQGKQVQGEKLSVEHHAPETISDTSFRCVLYDSATSIFAGNIKIPKGSSGSEGYEENKNLLLGEDCFTHAIPQLEIIENDVKCSHGATVSSTEPEELYFLMARGLTQKAAEELLVRSFYRDILDKMSLLNDHPEIKSYLYNLTEKKTGLNLNKNVYNWEE